ncbi:C45 family autoproteolytic acyltransferase/hydrolase [Lentisphaerota bacterium ZTH]|nr:linear amide C-N hydrolase [Lentisphaerota bacterium]WET07118.1 C45 family autoproteolytic acyltransferase/hydrolase [Lentisphaerota bacterium ZTH]
MRIITLFVPLLLLQLTQVNAAVIEKNSIICGTDKTDYLQVRHIVLRGSNMDIGKALGEIARRDYASNPGQYIKPIFAESRRAYMQRNFPAMLERMKGVAAAFGKSRNSNLYDFSALPYDAAPFNCSAVFIPPEHSFSKNPLLGRTCDFYMCSLAEMTGSKTTEKQPKLFQRSYVLEIYPDKGYASIAFGTMDLMNPMIGGMNEKGLVVCALADNDLPGKANKLAGGRSSGVNSMQLVRLILETCATVKEAKIAYINNKPLYMFDSAHFLVAEPSGKAAVLETAIDDLLPRITDNNGNVLILTNFALWKYPKITDFPDINPRESYNPFLRYLKLFNYVREHRSKFTEDDIKQALKKVFAKTTASGEGAAKPLPCRTFWRVIYNMSELTAKLIFYRHDLKTAGDRIELKFSKEMTFKLKLKNN